MKTCSTCKNCFRNNYDLTRHMSRLRPCFDINNVKKYTQSIQNGKDDIQNGKGDIQNGKDDIQNGKDDIQNGKKEKPHCIWCLNTFFNVSNRNVHIKKCKLVNDPIRKIEMELNIIPELDSSICRFCKKNYKWISRHICKEKENYIDKLKKTFQDNCKNCNVTINNVNNINNIININVHKDENIETLDYKLLIEELRKLNKIYGKENHFIIAGNLIIFLDGQITQSIENVNVFIENAKSMAGQLLTEKGWEILPSDEIIELKFKNTANKLVEMRPEIDKYNPKVFQQQDSCLTMNQVEQIGKHGLRNGPNTTGKRELKTKMKVNTIVNSKKIRELVPDFDF